MHIKKYSAPTVKEAIKAIKDEFGPDALILNTRRVKGAGGALFEVVAAVDYDFSVPINVDLNKAASSPAARAYGRMDGESQDGVKKKTPSDGPMEASSEALKKELKELKELKDLFWTMLSKSGTEVSGAIDAIKEDMVKNGVDKRLAEKILLKTFTAMPRESLKADSGYLKSVIRKNIFEKISVKDPLKENGVFAFIGPAGVGKTTTIAKLAALNALKKKRSVALLTMDTYRIAAVEQLRVYGKIMGIPVEVAKTAAELDALIRTNGDKDLVLIDTAGRSRKNAAHMKELKEMSAVNRGIRFNLVLSAQTRDDGLYEAVRAFGCVPIDSLTFTKLDETGAYGQILNTMAFSKRPAAYLTAGQRVPEDIEHATRERLVNFFIPN